MRESSKSDIRGIGANLDSRTGWQKNICHLKAKTLLVEPAPAFLYSIAEQIHKKWNIQNNGNTVRALKNQKLFIPKYDRTTQFLSTLKGLDFLSVSSWCFLRCFGRAEQPIFRYKWTEALSGSNNRRPFKTSTRYSLVKTNGYQAPLNSVTSFQLLFIS